MIGKREEIQTCLRYGNKPSSHVHHVILVVILEPQSHFKTMLTQAKNKQKRYTDADNTNNLPNIPKRK